GDLGQHLGDGRVVGHGTEERRLLPDQGAHLLGQWPGAAGAHEPRPHPGEELGAHAATTRPTRGRRARSRGTGTRRPSSPASTAVATAGRQGTTARTSTPRTSST